MPWRSREQCCDRDLLETSRGSGLLEGFGSQLFPWLAALEHAGLVDDVGNHLLLAVGHDVDTGNARNCHDLLDYLNTQLLAFTDRVGGRLEARNHRRGNVDAGNVAEDPACRGGRSEWADADDEETFLVEAEIAHPGHVALEHRRSHVHGEKRGSRYRQQN